MAKALTSARGIEHTPEVAGGSATLGGTRIAVWLVLEWSRMGLDAEQICELYPESNLTPPDIHAALEYARTHAAEIQQDLARQDEDDC